MSNPSTASCQNPSGSESIRLSQIETNRLSLYRTKNLFLRYFEIKVASQYKDLILLARELHLPLLFLGNGSNTFFSQSRIESIVVKNCLPKEIRHLEGDRFLVSSSVLVSEVLKYCFNSGRDSFYYLASVPAEVGGALAMNAGQGRHKNQSILDWVEEIHFVDQDGEHVATPLGVRTSYRRTMFTGQTNFLITGAVFRFPERDFAGTNPIKERVAWAKDNQDLANPNCGSTFKQCDHRIMYRLRGTGFAGARFSAKTDNWMTNRSQSPRGIRWLLRLARALHIVFFRKCVLEIIVVK
jgi:UDP-N-acetylmuramate dehydrogenase